MINFNPKFVDNDNWLYVKTGLSTFIDSLGVARKAARQKERFKNVRIYCVFVGYPRSGHSIVGSVIDAHPDALMAHRMNSLKYVKRGYSELELFYMMAKNSERYAGTNRTLTGYQYSIPNQWQGRGRDLKVVGDQEGNHSSVFLGQDPALLRRLLAGKQVKTKLIHVMRNPYDNITTWALRTQTSLEHNIERYFDRCHNMAKIKEIAGPDDLLDIRHEEFVGDFPPFCRRLMDFLGLDIDEDFIKDCSRVVYHSPNKSRHNTTWTPRQIKDVESQIARYPYLAGYTYES